MLASSLVGSWKSQHYHFTMPQACTPSILWLFIAGLLWLRTPEVFVFGHRLEIVFHCWIALRSSLKLLLPLPVLWGSSEMKSSSFGNDLMLWRARKSTGLGNNTCMWLQECCRQVEAEVLSKSRKKHHQTTYKKYYFQDHYIPYS